MNRWYSAWAGILVGLMCAGAATGQPPVINYQGRITTAGTNFTGFGFFKFVLHESDNGLWSNDGSPGIGEPVSALPIQVNHGLFNLDLGDTELGMMPIHPMIFHAGHLHLRTWFSTDNVAFEQLAPDTRIQPLRFADIDTGHLIIVDPRGRGDFQELQDAIDFASTHGQTTVLLQPGYYELSQPLTFNPNAFVRLMGAGDRGAAIIAHPGGTAMELRSAVIENLTVIGSPAIRSAVAGEDDHVYFEVRRCSIERDEDEAGGPALQMTGEAHAWLQDCSVENRQGGSGLLMSDSSGIFLDRVEIRAEDGIALEVQSDGWLKAQLSIFEGGGAPTIHIAGSAHLRLFQCEVNVEWESSDTALQVSATHGYSEFSDCRFQGPIVYTNTGAGAQFTASLIGRGAVFHNVMHAGLSFNECSFGHEQQTVYLDVVGGNPHLRVRNAYMHAYGAPCVRIRDSTGFNKLEGVEMIANDTAAVELIATIDMEEDRSVDLQLVNTRIHAGESATASMPAILLQNAAGNEEREVEVGITLTGCEVMGGMTDGIRASGPFCEVEVKQSNISGLRHGIFMESGGDLEIENSRINGEEGDAVHFAGPGGLFARSSEMWGGEEDNGRGLYLNMEEGFAFLNHCLLGSELGPALHMEAGMLHANHTALLSLGDTTTLLAGTNVQARFSHCVFSILAMLDEEIVNDAAAITLVGTTGQTPTPSLLHCTLETSPDATYALDLDGGAVSGQVQMVHTISTKPIHPGITKIPPASQDAYGNIVLD